MRFSLSLSILLFCTVAVAGPFDVPDAEKGKKGTYTIEQPGVPIHEDYAEIYRHNHGDRLTKAGNFYKLKHAKAKFKIFVPDSYNPALPAGIAYVGIVDSRSLNTDIDKTFEYCKDFFNRRNLIAIAIDAKEQPIGVDTTLDYQHEYSVLIRRSIDIVKERYKIDPERILAFSDLYSMPLFMAAICCPKILKNNAFNTAPHSFYDNMPHATTGKKILSFGSQDQEITTAKEASKNTFVFFRTAEEDNELKKMRANLNKNTEDLFKRIKFRNTKFIDIELGNDLDIFIQAYTKIDPKPFDAKAFFIAAQKFEKQKNFPKAFENYKAASAYGIKEAKEKFEPMVKELQDNTAVMVKAHTAKNYPEAHKLAVHILKMFGAPSAPKAVTVYQSYAKDKKITTELKAAAFLDKAESALKKPNPPKEKVKEACEKVMKICPGTFTAKRAKALMESL